MRPHFFPNRLVEDDKFFGRMVELPHVLQRLSDDQSVLITGERRIGKSSLLRRAYHLQKAAGSESESYFLDSYIITDLNETLTKLLSPKSRVSELKQIVKDQDKQLKLFINDMDGLFVPRNDNKQERHAATIRGFIDSGHMVIAAVSYHPHLDIETSVDREQFFNVFTQCPLRAFSLSEAEYFISKSCELSGEPVAENEVALIIDLAGTVPYHLQEFGYTLFALTNFVGSDGGDRLDCFYKAATSITERLSILWASRISDEWSDDIVQTLLAIAGGESELLDIPAAQWLITRGIIDEGDNRFLSMGRIFAEFLHSFPKSGAPTPTEKGVVARLTEGTLRTVIDAVIKSHIHP